MHADDVFVILNYLSFAGTDSSFTVHRVASDWTLLPLIDLLQPSPPSGYTVCGAETGNHSS